MDIRPGDTVFGDTQDERYKVVEAVGAGSFGIVYKVLDSEDNPFALKSISTASLDNTGLQTLTNEGRLATEIRHPNVLRVFFFHDGTKYANLPPYMLMEYADGGSLGDILKTRQQSAEFFSIQELRTMFVQLASGMKAINAKLVHRDVKPDNILIADGVLKISDFGLAKIVGAATRTQTLKGINHIRYCAPEAWLLDRNTPAMDMYSMGIVFYELATLTHPYHVDATGDLVDAWKNAHLTKVADDPRKQNPDLPLWLVQLVSKMISKRPQDRYSSWDEVIERCKETREGSTVSIDVSTLVQRVVASHEKEEQARLRAEQERRKEVEFLRVIEYSFGEITSAVMQIVDTFNKTCDFAELHVRKLSELHILITSRASLEVQVVPAEGGHKLDGNTIKAWGHARSHSGRGFNLILVPTSSDDLYGRWVTLHVRHNPNVREPDKRPDPFPFEIYELPREIELLNAYHIYNTDKKPFSADMFIPLIEELL